MTTLRSSILATRKANLERLMLDKFRGNRAALARAAGVHPNHINLLLSGNPVHSRNMGEEFARRLEESLGLPIGWFDRPIVGQIDSIPLTISGIPIHGSMTGAVRATDAIAGIQIFGSRLGDIFRGVTAPENLILAVIDSNDASPAIAEGDVVVLDIGVRAIHLDGVYVIGRPDSGAMLRLIDRDTGGELTMRKRGDQPVVLTRGITKSTAVFGRVVAKLSVTPL